jgi:SAM-dependent methyltransferase
MRPSQPLYDVLAPTYKEHFNVPHRRLYDTLAWERVLGLLPPPGPDVGPVVDAGCGVGRWARMLIERGYEVVGVEQSPGMLAELDQARLGPGFTLVRGSMDAADVDAVMRGRPAAMVFAMGSVQYTADPADTVARLASWLAPGASLAVLVDSLVGLVLELIGSGRDAEAAERLHTRRGVWRIEGASADLHLLDRAALTAAFEAAGLGDVTAAGLLVGAGPLGRDRLQVRLDADFDAVLEQERRWAADPVLADAGKQLLVTGRRSD